MIRYEFRSNKSESDHITCLNQRPIISTSALNKVCTVCTILNSVQGIILEKKHFNRCILTGLKHTQVTYNVMVSYDIEPDG